MKKTTTLILLFLFIGATPLAAQKLDSKKYLNNTFASYNKELKLSTEKAEKFKDILEKYNVQIAKLIKDKKDSPLNFNKVVKLQDLAVFNLLSGPEFTIYKREKAIIEPLKKYRR